MCTRKGGLCCATARRPKANGLAEWMVLMRATAFVTPVVQEKRPPERHSISSKHENSHCLIREAYIMRHSETAEKNMLAWSLAPLFGACRCFSA